MNIIKKIGVFGDSILKGIQINPDNSRYRVDNHIDIDAIAARHNLQIANHSKFGLTIGKAEEIMQRQIAKEQCDTVVMDYGGNDCDFNWAAISEQPDALHLPKTPIEVFTEKYHEIIRALKSHGIQPILTTLPPLDSQRFFNWFCGKLNRENILRWLDGVESIYRYQENYSRTVEKIAKEENVPIVDLRGAFLKNRTISHLLCEDGTHPNTEGQKVITAAFLDFAQKIADDRRMGRLNFA